MPCIILRVYVHEHVHVVMNMYPSLPPALPATSIALDETRIYWSLDGSGVFYVARDNRNVAVMAEGGNNASTIVTLSPGLQPLPCEPPLSIVPQLTCRQLDCSTYVCMHQ